MRNQYSYYGFGDLVVVASGSITAGNALLDTTTANAFAAPVGVDLSAYQDGNHILALYQATKTAYAWISDTAPGGETVTTYTSNFGTNADGFNSYNGTSSVTGNIDGIGGQDDTLRTTINALSSTHGIQRAASSLTVGSLFRFRYNYYIPSTNSNLNKIRLFAGGYAQLVEDATLDAWTAKDATRTITDVTGALVFLTYAGSSLTYQDAGGDDVFYIKSVVVDKYTDCAITGALLLSTKGGARGWIRTSIDPNAAMTYQILSSGN